MAYEFPEAQWPAPPALEAEYLRRCELGRKHMAESTVAICGLARDLGDGVDSATAAIDAIGAMFKDWRCVVYENDSQDDTLDRLRMWASEPLLPRTVILSDVKQWPKWGPVRDKTRTLQMAHYREIYRQAAVSRFGGCNYAIVLDLDIGRYSLDGIANSFGYRDLSWDAVVSNGEAVVKGRRVQYDAYAWRDVGHPQPMLAKVVNPRLFKRGEPPFFVLSAFGGLGLYTMPAFRSSQYDGRCCEHVAFHQGMGRVLFNPSQIVAYP